MIAAPKQKSYQYTDADRMDQTIAVGLAATQMLSPEGSQAVVKALSGNNPPAMLAAFLARIIEMILTHSASTDIPMSPVVFLSEGGAVDELAQIVQVIADKNGVQIDAAQLMPAVKQELMKMSQAANQKMQQQPQGGPPMQGAQPTGAPL